MKVINRNLSALMMVLMIFALIPSCNFVYADEAINSEEVEEDYIEPTIDEYLICDDSPMTENEEVNVESISYFSAIFTRLSSTSAQAKVAATSTRNSLTSKVYLQKYNSSKETYANVKGVSSTKTVSAYSISHSPKFSISSNGKYRVKVVLSDGLVTSIKYKNLS